MHSGIGEHLPQRVRDSRHAAIVGADARMWAVRVSCMGDWKTLSIPMPSVPADAPWQLSLAGYLRQRTELPSLALKPLGLLDRYGEITVGPDAMAFDGEDVAWDKVIRLVVRDVVDVVSQAAMAHEAEKIRSMLPPVPGRKWVVDRAMALLGDIAGPRLMRAHGGDVVSEVVYRGAFGREKTLQAGVFAALIMAKWPDVQRSLVATARVHGIEVYGEAPVEAAPAEVVPVEAGSVEAAPVEAAPVEIVPIEITPVPVEEAPASDAPPEPAAAVDGR
ncbi:MAG: hypothetical protein ACJ786_16210 [Catenulispora sp.]